jgi:hypothetical protein
MKLHLPGQSILIALVALALCPGQPGARPRPGWPAGARSARAAVAGLAAVRARFEGLTEAQVRVMGYTNAAPSASLR